MGYKDLLSYSSTMATPYSLPINENTIWKLLNLESNIKESILGLSFFQVFSKKKGKISTQHKLPLWC